MHSFWLLLQLSDSAFPTGGFAHSNGLEAAMQSGAVHSRSFLSFVTQVLDNLATGYLPYFCATHRVPEQWHEWDHRLDAFLTSPASNRASRTQGRTLLATYARVFPSQPFALWQREIREEVTPGHLATTQARLLRSLDVPEKESCEVFVYQTLRTVFSAAVRLGIVGTHEAQQQQLQLASWCESAVDEGRRRSIEQACISAPLQEFWGGLHDGLYSRLFLS